MMHDQKKHPQPKRDRHWLLHPGLWIPVLLMLLAMAVYVMTMDESIRPAGDVQPPVPAAP
ncbi:MAG TPA: hypothetical protein VHZ24_20245 [Pirellulales bacterium]|jgi:hypothetical protein|nr:hypothetical protein [Pirellulales bacterium]